MCMQGLGVLRGDRLVWSYKTCSYVLPVILCTFSLFPQCRFHLMWTHQNTWHLICAGFIFEIEKTFNLPCFPQDDKHNSPVCKSIQYVYKTLAEFYKETGTHGILCVRRTTFQRKIMEGLPISCEKPPLNKQVHSFIVQFQKISILPPQKVMEFPGGVGGSARPKNVKKCMKLIWNFQRGGWS